MPAYGLLGPTDLRPGESANLFSAETLAAPISSQAIARGPSPNGSDSGTTFQILFAAAPTAVVEIQGSNVDSDAAYVTLYSSANTQADAYSDHGLWRFYRARLASMTAGGLLTVACSR